MPSSHHFDFTEEDLTALRSAQKLIRNNLNGQDVPLEVLAVIAVRSVHSHLLATEVLSTLTRQDFTLLAEESGA